MNDYRFIPIEEKEPVEIEDNEDFLIDQEQEEQAEEQTPRFFIAS